MELNTAVVKPAVKPAPAKSAVPTSPMRERAAAKKPVAKPAIKPVAKPSQKPQAKPEGQPSVASTIRDLIKAGKSNEQIWAIVKPKFTLDDAKKNYPAWYRSQLNRTKKAK